MSPLPPELRGLYVWGDLLGDGAETRLRRAVLPGLLRAIPDVEARRFWPARGVCPPAGRTLVLSDGARHWNVRTAASEVELADIGRAVRGTAPAGSPVLALAGPNEDPTPLVRAWIADAGPVLLVDPADCPADGELLTELLAASVAEDRPGSVTDLLLLAPVLGPSGYAAEGRYLFEHFEARPDVRVCLRPLRFGRAECAEDLEFLRGVREAAARSPRPGHVALHLVFPPQFKPDPTASRNILRTMYETDGVPSSWLAGLQRADELWVPSAFHVRSFARSGIPRDRIRVVPESLSPAFDPARFARSDPSATRPRIFLSIFDWSERKAPDVLLRTFGRTFRRGEAVLRLKVHSSLGRDPNGLHREALAHVADGARAAGHEPPELELLTGMPSPAEMPRLYADADVFVLASRGEGWGRPVHEAMAMGLPVVATTFGGTQELLGGAGVGFPVAGRVVPCSARAVAEVPELRGQRWLEPDPADLGRKLRAVYARPDEARAVGARARRWVQRRFRPRIELEPRPSRNDVLVLEGPVFEASSYGGINRQLARALRARGRFDLRLRPTAEPDRDPGQDADLLPLLEPPDGRPGFCLRSGWPISPAPPDAGAWIQRVDWEYGAPPVELASLLSHGPDQVWVHSRPVRDELLSAGVPAEKLWTVPHGFDPQRFRPGRPPLPWVREWAGDRRVFLFVGGTIWRKGIDLLLQAWLTAFGAEDRVCLLLRGGGGEAAYAGQGIGELLARVERMPGIAPIRVLRESLSDDDMGRLYCSADALVHPYRGEGFGLPVLEAQACGLPVLVTAGGPTDEFVDARSALRVASSRVEVRIPEICAGRNHVLQPDIDALVAGLRTLRDDRELAANGPNVAADLHRELSWDAIAARVERRLREPRCPAFALAAGLRSS